MDFLNLKFNNSKKHFNRCYSTQANVEMGQSNPSCEKLQINPFFNLLSDCKSAINTKESVPHPMKNMASNITSMSVSYFVGSFIRTDTPDMSTSNNHLGTFLDVVMGNSAYPSEKQTKSCFNMVTESLLPSFSCNLKPEWKDKFSIKDILSEVKINENLNTFNNIKPMRTYAEVTKQNLKPVNVPQENIKDFRKSTKMESKCNFNFFQSPLDNCLFVKVKENLSKERGLIRPHTDSVSSESSQSSLASDQETESKCRLPSECSVESDDSCVEFIYDEDFEVPNIFTDEDVIESEDDEDILFTDTEEVDNTDSLPSPVISLSDLEAANKRWKDFYEKSEGENNKKQKVSFSDQINVHHLFVWDFASRAARIGDWEILARDSVRFRRRIQETSPIISKILDPEHRSRIYHQRFFKSSQSSLSSLHSTIKL